MGNAESNSEGEENRLLEEERAQAIQAIDQSRSLSIDRKRPSNASFQYSNLTYDDIYMSKISKDDDASSEQSIEEVPDSSDEAVSIGLSEFPDSVSQISTRRTFVGEVNVTILHNNQILRVGLHGSTGIPGKREGGYDIYQMVLTLLPGVGQTFESTLRVGPNPIFNTSWETSLAPNALNRSHVKFQLFGCLRGEKVSLCGEAFVNLEVLRTGMEAPMSLVLQPYGWQNAREHSPQAVPASRFNIRHRSEIRSLASERSVGAGNPHCRPELFLNASYNRITGRLECIVQRTRRLYLPGKRSGQPNPFLHLVLKTEDDKILAQSKSKHLQQVNNPSFDDVFVFNVKEFQIESVTMTINVMHRSRTGKKIFIGQFFMGRNNSSQAESEHWAEIMDASGERIARWHLLFL